MVWYLEYRATSHLMAVYSEYGFAEKVVEGMSVRINSITIKVKAQAFHASFELWQLQGNSLNPKWQRSDLRYTRITDPKRGEVQHRARLVPSSHSVKTRFVWNGI